MNRAARVRVLEAKSGSGAIVPFALVARDALCGDARVRASTAALRWGLYVSDERAAGKLDKQIGARVRARRLEIGMSQEQLAEALGVTFQQIQKYEKGINRIAASRLFDMSAALDLPIERFFQTSRAAMQPNNGKLMAALAGPEVADLVRTFSKIKSARTRARVLELVRAMSSEP